MEVIAKTDSGFLITATKNEVSEILKSVQGSQPTEIHIGQKISAVDYAGTITELKTLERNYRYTQLVIAAQKFTDVIAELSSTVEKVSKLCE